MTCSIRRRAIGRSPIAGHEIAHRDFFKAALKKNAIPALEVDFTKIDFNSRDSVLTTARTFEDLGVAAYNGAGQLLEKGEYLLLAGKIVSVEARHATAIRYLIGMKGAENANAGNSGTTVGSNTSGANNANASSNSSDVVNEKGLDQALKPAAVLQAAGKTEKGQIYIPRVNWLLLVAVLYLVFAFKSSSALASAYGIAVTGTMVITSIMAFFVMWRCWKWSPVTAALVIAPFIAVDTVFLMANLLKVVEGGWIPLAIGAGLMTVMLTWRRGTNVLFERTRKDEVPIGNFIQTLLSSASITRVKGMAVFLTGHPDSTPTSLLHNLKHNKVLHEHNIILQVITEDTPRVSNADRIELKNLSDRFTRITLRFGYMESPNVPKALVACRALGLKFDVMSTSFFLSRRSLRPALHSKMPHWQDKLFINLARSADDASRYFHIPSGRAVEVGTQITI